MEIKNVEREAIEPIGGYEVEEKDQGLLKVLENKQRQIDQIKERINNMEKNNEKLDRKGEYDTIEKLDFDFDIEGKM